MGEVAGTLQVWSEGQSHSQRHRQGKEEMEDQDRLSQVMNEKWDGEKGLLAATAVIK